MFDFIDGENVACMMMEMELKLRNLYGKISYTI